MSFLNKSLSEHESLLGVHAVEELNDLSLSLADLVLASHLVGSVLRLDVEQFVLDLLPNLVCVVLLVLVKGVNLGEVVGHRSHSVLEVHQVVCEVLDVRHVGVEFPLGNHRVTLEVMLRKGEVLKDLHESDLVSIW